MINLQMMIRLCSGRSKFIVQPFEFLDFILVLIIFTMNIIFYLQEDYANTTRMILNRSSGSQAGLLIVLLRLWRVQKIVRSLVDESRLHLMNQLILIGRDKNLNDHKIDLLVAKIEDYEHEIAYLKERNKRNEREKGDLMNQLKSCAIVINNAQMNQKQVSTFAGRHPANLGTSLIFGHGTLPTMSRHDGMNFDTTARKMRSNPLSSSSRKILKCPREYNDNTDHNVYSNINLRDEDDKSSSDDEDAGRAVPVLPVVRSVIAKSKGVTKQVKAMIEPSNVSTFKPKAKEQPSAPSVNTFAQVLAGRITSDVQNIISAKLVNPSSPKSSSSADSSESVTTVREEESNLTPEPNGLRRQKEDEKGHESVDTRALNRINRPQVTARKSLKQALPGKRDQVDDKEWSSSSQAGKLISY